LITLLCRKSSIKRTIKNLFTQKLIIPLKNHKKLFENKIQEMKENLMQTQRVKEKKENQRKIKFLNYETVLIIWNVTHAK
jgi:hypothetical protein